MFSRDMRISLIEDSIAFGDKKVNLSKLKENLLQVPDDTDVVVLPELFSTGFTSDKDAALELAEKNTGDAMSFIHSLANSCNVAFCGSFLARTAGQIYNRGFFIEPNGEEVFYDKKHLFSIGHENSVINAGFTEAPVVRFRGLNIKLTVCYDLRFPVFCRNRDNAYDVLVCVANWPKARLNAWRTLLAARAIENEAYVVGLNRSGIDNFNVDYGSGSSAVFDFRGEVIAQRGKSPVITAKLSPSALQGFRKSFPAWKDADEFTLSV
ncbi:MAG: nitrilase-related carbon-nitrogen hydrolase [Sodaliphilus sp.]|nr:nitrilase-related carbon-nitrogen hydrolase [Sodaliphilus sp.]